MNFLRIITFLLALGTMPDAFAMKLAGERHDREGDSHGPAAPKMSGHQSRRSAARPPIEVNPLVQLISLDSNGTPTLRSIEHIARCCCACDGSPCVRMVSGGANNAGVFIVKYPVQSFIIKFLPWAKNRNLRAENDQVIANTISVFRHGLGCQSHFARTYGFVQCQSPRGALTAEVMECARGGRLIDILEDPELDPGVKQDVCEAVGEALARMHQKNLEAGWRTIVHGDSHFENMYYDFETGEVTWIDCEKSAYSTARNRKQSILWDIQAFIINPLFYGGKALESPEEIKPLIQCYQAFIAGYVGAFEESKREALSSYIKHFIGGWVDTALTILIGGTSRKAQAKINEFVAGLDEMLCMHPEFKYQVEAILEGFLGDLKGCDERRRSWVKANLEVLKAIL